MRKIIIAGNWKMNNNIAESVELADNIKSSDKVDVIIAPVYVALDKVKETVGGKIILAAQNMHYEENGAFTGEISPLMLKDICTHIILGHSERRHVFNESDELINKKIISGINHDLKIIFCIGEKKEQRDEGKTNEVLKTQLIQGLKDVADLNNIIIAYEPVWAIGTGDVATPEQAEEAHKFIRSQISSLYNEEAANAVQILYGGSVKPDNADSLLSLEDIDGALVGGASLKADSFNALIESGEKNSD